MRFLHCADLHIGCCTRYPGSLERCKLMLQELLQVVSRYSCEYLVISGDFSRSPGTSHEERALVAELFKRTPVPIISITGNHDKWGREYNETSLNWLVGLAPKLGHRVWDMPSAAKVGGVWWLGIPYGGYNTVELHLVTHYLLSQVPKSWKGPVIALCHEFIEGATMDSGMVGKGKKYPKLPTTRRIKYWALGDLHSMQQVASNAWYSGAPYQTTFGELPEKGVLVVDTSKRKPKFIEITKPIPMVTMTEVPEEWPEAYVRLKVRPEDVPYPIPPNVVQITTPSLPSSAEGAKEIRTLVSAAHLLEGLENFVKGKLPEDLVDRAMKYAHELVKQIQPD